MMGRPKGSYRARIQLPDGEIVTGWDAATARLERRSVGSLTNVAIFDAERGVHVLPADLRRGPRPLVRVRLPDGETVAGWREVARRLGLRSPQAARARAERGPDGGYVIPDRPPRPGRPLGFRPAFGVRATTPEQDAAIVAAYVRGDRIRVICREHAVSRKVIARAVCEAGVPRRAPGWPRKERLDA
jgi:hypothetical protein